MPIALPSVSFDRCDNVWKVLLIEDQAQRSAPVREALRASGCNVVLSLASTTDLSRHVNACAPDLILVFSDALDACMLENLAVVNRQSPRPVVVFTHEREEGKIRAAVQAGVSAYIVDGFSMDRVKPILDVAAARFERYQALRNELEATEEKLAERKAVERAKGILMKSRQLSEDDAYRALRKMAMDRNLRLAEIAEQVISVSKLLG